MDRPQSGAKKAGEPLQVRADLGAPGRELPPDLAASYFVETSFGDEVAGLIAARSGRAPLLKRLAPVLHERFGCDARLMLAAPWSLFEPIGPRLQITVFTALDESSAAKAASEIETAWSTDLKENELILLPIPLSRLSENDRRRLGKPG